MNYQIQPCKWAIRRYGEDASCEDCPFFRDYKKRPCDMVDDLAVEIEGMLHDDKNT